MTPSSMNTFVPVTPATPVCIGKPFQSFTEQFSPISSFSLFERTVCSER